MNHPTNDPKKRTLFTAGWEPSTRQWRVCVEEPGNKSNHEFVATAADKSAATKIVWAMNMAGSWVLDSS